MEHQLEMQRRNVANAGSLTTSLAELLGETPAQLAAELLAVFYSTELHLLLLGELGLVHNDDNEVRVAELVLLMQVTDLDLIRHVAARRGKTFVLHTTVDGMKQQIETIAATQDDKATAADPLHVYKEQYAPEFKGFDAPVQYKVFGRC